MKLSLTLDQIHADIKANKWYRYFAIFNRIALAAGFIPSGLTKIIGERFTSLSNEHPMGNYLEALFHTGYYYPFIGYMQVLAAILLLIPRTTTLGALIYFPIILNICILSLSVGFDGSLVTSPLMVLANLYLICYDYDKIKYVLPLGIKPPIIPLAQHSVNQLFPVKFFIGVIATIILTVLMVTQSYQKKTRNTYEDCIADCDPNGNIDACINFCACIHMEGNSFDECTELYEKAQTK
ncbi:DoxX family protein [Penaeicola halotolerans]|uniref:DoxX family protein n=1 Tax=Penaeicola halotolerans TaxID=2793196 RepID=UPI001CF82C30|nr:DoxX family protein [Penaeicola halotolerans]